MSWPKTMFIVAAISAVTMIAGALCEPPRTINYEVAQVKVTQAESPAPTPTPIAPGSSEDTSNAM